MAKRKQNRILGSFRDPSGFVFEEDGQIYRKITSKGLSDHALLKKSGLYSLLTKKGLLVKHGSEKKLADSIILKPKKILLISYPYEWTFGQLKEAALVTLEIQKLALKYGMTLKDASAYNIQFQGGKPVLIDTTSFEKHTKGAPWTAYRQFCEHFYAPLVLMAKKDLRLGQLQTGFLDGIPLDLAVSLLPKKAFLEKEILMHLYFHSLSLKNSADRVLAGKTAKISIGSAGLIIDSLKKGIEKLKVPRKQSYWKDYYEFSNYTENSFSSKKREVEKILKAIKPNTVLDIGANTGVFSKIAAKYSKSVVSTDYDPVVMQENYRLLGVSERSKVLPLIVDIMNPPPGLGWQNAERTPFLERIKPDCVMALAVVHHLVISNNLNFKMLAEFFQKTTQKYALVEFVDVADSQIKDLFAQRGIREDYTIASFEKEFSKKFKLIHKVRLMRSQRYLYLYARSNEKKN